jgi:hypothetical protein
MSTELTRTASRFSSALSGVNRHHLKLIRDLSLSSKITALRATQAHALAAHALLRRRGGEVDRMRHFEQVSKQTMREARRVVNEAELLYRVEPNRIAGWRPNPTAYRFGYLWTVRSLYYWRRDHERIVGQIRSACFRNIVNPLELAFGVSTYAPNLSPIKRLTEMLIGREVLDECLTVSRDGPHGAWP